MKTIALLVSFCTPADRSRAGFSMRATRTATAVQMPSPIATSLQRIGVDVKLFDHLANVEAKAQGFARSAGLDDRLTKLVALAARLHDLGKVDPRFQADLRGMNTLLSRDPALASLMQSNWAPLAKSKRIGFHRGPRATPKGFRHEALSVALAAKYPEVTALDEDDRDLVLWLIGTHHGHGRPFFPPCLDPQPATTSEVRHQQHDPRGSRR